VLFVKVQPRRYLTNKVVPGTRVTVLGVYDIFQQKAKVMLLGKFGCMLGF
jgi:hypothetical protein